MIIRDSCTLSHRECGMSPRPVNRVCSYQTINGVHQGTFVGSRPTYDLIVDAPRARQQRSQGRGRDYWRELEHQGCGTIQIDSFVLEAREDPFFNSHAKLQDDKHINSLTKVMENLLDSLPKITTYLCIEKSIFQTSLLPIRYVLQTLFYI